MKIKSNYVYLIAFSILFLGFQPLDVLFAQAEIRTGCLRQGDRAGTYIFEDEVGGTISVTGHSALERFAARNARVRLTGTMATQQGRSVFQVTEVEYISDDCGLTLEFSRDALEEAIGRARFGVRAGGGLDPESVWFGAHAQVGPIIRNVWFRPNFEVGFAEITDVYTLNLEAVYFLPLVARGAEFWTAYAGAGPGLNLIDRNFEGEDDEDIDFDDTDTDLGLNVLLGVAHTTGFFGELRAGAYGSPPLRIMIGYTF